MTISWPPCRPFVRLVEVGEAGRHADHRAAAVGDRLDLVEGALHDVGEREVVLAGAALGDGVELGLGAVDDLVGLAAVGAVAHLDDLGAGLDEAAQDGALAHDPGVVGGVGRRGDRRDQRVQVGRAADPGDLAALGQLGGDGDGVGGLAAAVEVEDRVVDGLVGRLVEVAGAQHLDDVGDRVLAQQHPAEDALLGGEVLRRGALERRGRTARQRPSNSATTHRATAPSTSTAPTALIRFTLGVVRGDSDKLARRAQPASALAACPTTRAVESCGPGVRHAVGTLCTRRGRRCGQARRGSAYTALTCADAVPSVWTKESLPGSAQVSSRWTDRSRSRTRVPPSHPRRVIME